MIGQVRGVAGAPVTLRGYAMEFGQAVCALEFSLDEGATWKTYATPDMRDDLNVDWTFTFTPEHAGAYAVLVRAVDAAGTRTPSPARVEVLVA